MASDKINIEQLYEQFFPELSEIVLETYIIRLRLISQKCEYNLTEECEGIRIPECLSEVVNRFNTHPSRVKDFAQISNLVVRKSDILLSISFKEGAIKRIGSIVGNTFSKWLFREYGFSKLLNIINDDKPSIFEVEAVKVK